MCGVVASDEKKSFMGTPPKNGVIVSDEGGRALKTEQLSFRTSTPGDNATTLYLSTYYNQRAKTRVRENYHNIVI